MAKQDLNLGTAANDGTGDDLRTAGTKINQNFTELYTDVASLQSISGVGTSGVSFDSHGLRFEGVTADSFETVLTITDPTKDNTLLLPDSSGTLATIAEIKKQVDSAYISFITGTAFDSGSTLTLINQNSIDSARSIQLIDSAYVQLRQTISSFDSAETLALIDSAYIKFRADSSYITSIIDSSHIKSQITLLDSAKVLSIADSAQLDSAEVVQMIDSSYVQTRADVIKARNYTVATKPASGSIPHGTIIFVKDGASGDPCLAVYDSDGDSSGSPGFFRRIALGNEIST